MIRHLLLPLFLASSPVLADSGSRLIASGGITGFEGTAGGGITPWAFIGGYASKEEVSYSANIQYLSLSDYSLTTAGASVNGTSASMAGSRLAEISDLVSAQSS